MHLFIYEGTSVKKAFANGNASPQNRTLFVSKPNTNGNVIIGNWLIFNKS